MAYLSSSPAGPSNKIWHPINVFGGDEQSLSSSGGLSSPPFGSSSAAGHNPHLKPFQPPRRSSSSNSSSSNGSKSSESSHSYNNNNNIRTGELSPSFDQTFQSSMNISASDMQTHQDDDENDDYHHNAATGSSHSLHSPLHLNVPPHFSTMGAGFSPSGMDYSPAPPPPPAPPLLRFTSSSQAPSNKSSSSNILVPSNVPPPQFHRPTLHHANTITAASTTTSTSTNSKSSFDSSFFSKLAAHSSSSTANSPSRSRTRSADVPLSNKDVNAAAANPAPSIGLGFPASIPKFSEKHSNNASSSTTLPLKKPHGLLRAASARPSLFAPTSASPSTLIRPSSSASCRGSSNVDTSSSSKDENNPFKASPRPTVFMERAQSDSSLSFGNTFTRPNAGVRRPSNLGSGSFGSSSSASSSTTISSTSTNATSRPSIVPFGGAQSTSQGRKISGSGRVRSALPKEWQTQSSSSCHEFTSPPPLNHAHSAPLVRPPSSIQHIELEPKANSDPQVPTRRTLGCDSGSRLAKEVFNAADQHCSNNGSINDSSSPNSGGMDVDTSISSLSHHSNDVEEHVDDGDNAYVPSSPIGITAVAVQDDYTLTTGSPGLGDLFNSDGIANAYLTSPDQPSQITNRKRGIEDADSSFNSQLSSSPVPSASTGIAFGVSTLSSAAAAPAVITAVTGNGMSNLNGSSLGRSNGPKLLHRATSALSLGAASRRRGSGNFNATQSSSNLMSAFAEAAVSGEDSGYYHHQQHQQQNQRPLTLSGTTLLSRENSGSSRHRKMSRGADGKPLLLKSGRRSHSMCDSEFYASPPLAPAESAQALDYFGQVGNLDNSAGGDEGDNSEEVEEILAEHALSPPRKALAPLTTYQPSPEASFTCGFGHKEAQGKILPCFPVKEDGLMRITADTLNDLLGGVYDDHIEQYVIIDCRFEYEYSGGHVEGAINLGTDKSVEKFLLEAGRGEGHLYEDHRELPLPSKSGEKDQAGNGKKTILVFHCEFSAKRAPTLAKFLRSKDRALNHAAYPAVHFPELYILQGGYAECWSKYPDRCEPRGYVPMDDPRHLAARANDLGELRRKRIGIRAKSYTFGEGMFAAKPTVQPKHMSGINFKPVASSSLASSSFTASSLSGNNNTNTGNASGSIGPAKTNRTRGSFNGNLFNVINSSQLCIHEEEHDDEDDNHDDQPADSSAEKQQAFGMDTNNRHRMTSEGLAELQMDNSSPCGPMLGSDAIALGGMSLGDSPCQGSKPTKFIRPSMAPLQPSNASRGLFKARGMQRASTAIGANFLH